MEQYEPWKNELAAWRLEMMKKPGYISGLSTGLQKRINRAIPEKVHEVITSAIKQMTRAVTTGAGMTNSKPPVGISFQVREHLVHERIQFYSKTAAAEGAVTGAGGILLSLADFPLWLSIKMKLLFEIAALYGYDTSDFKERIYILHIFQLTFSSQAHRNTIFGIMDQWKEERHRLPDDIHSFDWRKFQQEYRDYIDIAKLLQLIPGIGAVVGAYVNHKLTGKLGNTAMNSYRLRWEQEPPGRQAGFLSEK